VNIHLYASVRCASPGGPLDLVVPVADVPVITWFFDGQPDLPESALLGRAVAAGTVRARMSKRRAWTLAAAGCGLMVAAVVAAANVNGHPWWRIIALTAHAALGLSGAPVHGRSARPFVLLLYVISPTASGLHPRERARRSRSGRFDRLLPSLEMYSDLRVCCGRVSGGDDCSTNVPRMASPICRDLNGRALLE
jgi:hypothetical protein